MPAPIQPSQTLVNTTTTGDQLAPRMIRLADGGWLIVWMGRDTVVSSSLEFHAFGQRYDSSGVAVGVEFQISNAAPGQVGYYPDIAALPDGGWIAVWHSIPVPFTGFGDTIVYTRRYDADGSPGAAVQVNAPDGYPHGMQAVITVLGGGGWIVALHSMRPDGSGRDVYGYLYDSAGSAIGSPFRINSSAADHQDTVAIAALTDGGWIATWQSQGQDSSGSGVYSQRFDAAGNPVGGETLVNATIIGDQARPSVAGLADGGWIVVWTSAGVDGSGLAVVSQRYQASGALFGGQNQVNGIVAGDQDYATVAAMPDGGYVVRWLSEDIGVTSPTGARQMGVYVQRHDSAGGPLAPGIRIGTTTENDGDAAALAPTDTGWITAWADFGADGSGFGIYAASSNALSTPATTINGTESDDFIVGTADPEIINGLGGNDLLLGEGGDDELNGGEGDDTLGGQSGVDSFDGGAGFDRVSLHEEEATQAVVADLRTQTISNDGYGNVETMVSIEALGGGTRFADFFYGDDNRNLLVGSNGDTLYAFAGDDDFVVDGAPLLLDGGDGTDRIGLFRQTRLIDLNGDGIGEMETTTNGVHVDLALGRIVDDGFGGSGDIVSIENLSGSAGDDILRGDALANGLAGVAGNDILQGFGGDDGLSGNDGNDVLEGGEGNDIALGGAGNDSLAGGAGNDGLAGDDGDDFLDGGEGSDILGGGADEDNLAGGGGDDVLLGELGDDVLDGGAGWDHLDGGSGTDTASYASAIGGVDVFLSSGAVGEYDGETHLSDDSLTGIENVTGSLFDDAIRGDANGNLLRGIDGADLLFGLAGDDTLEGGNGDDFLVSGAGWDELDGGAGIDTVSYAGAVGSVDVFLALGAVGEFDGETHLSDDTLSAIENVFGSQFDDAIRGDSNANLLRGLGGNDLLFGLGGDDLLQGGLGHDNIRGYDGADTLQGGDGNDLLRGGNGDDVMDGGAGFDRASFFGTPGEALPATGVTVSLLLQGLAQNTGHGWDILTGFEALNGTAFNDQLTGDNQANWLLLVGGGNDTASGEGGDDLIEAADGNHVLSGGAGIDTASFAPGSATGPVTVSLAMQGGVQATGIGAMFLTGFENLSGTAFGDTLGGDANANLLAGDEGNDALNGGDGNDTLYGDGAVAIDFPDGVGTSGPIAIFTDRASGNDTLNGGKGDDLLVGGGGDDQLTGAQGSDTFAFADGCGDDVITDFEKKDTILIDAAGVDDFSDLIVTSNGNGDAVISWGTGDSVTLEHYKVGKLAAANFDFGEPAALALSLADPGSIGDGGLRETIGAEGWLL